MEKAAIHNVVAVRGNGWAYKSFLCIHYLFLFYIHLCRSLFTPSKVTCHQVSWRDRLEGDEATSSVTLLLHVTTAHCVSPRNNCTLCVPKRNSYTLCVPKKQLHCMLCSSKKQLHIVCVSKKQLHCVFLKETAAHCVLQRSSYTACSLEKQLHYVSQQNSSTVCSPLTVKLRVPKTNSFTNIVFLRGNSS